MLQRLLGIALTALGLAVALVFASLAAAVLVAAGVLAWTWAWWNGRGRVRHDRRGAVIEGEYRDETHLERLSDLKRR